MYLRNVKQFIKNSLPTFDEHRYGFHSFLEAVRSAQRAGLFRLERNRQGILRVFPGNQMPQGQRAGMMPMEGQPMAEAPVRPYDVEDDIVTPPQEPPADLAAAAEEAVDESQPEPEIPPVEAAALAEETQEKVARKRRVSSGIKRKTVAPRKSAAAPLKRGRKKTSPPPEEGNLP